VAKDRDETWRGGRPRLRPHCIRWIPSSPSPKGAQPPFLAHVHCGQMAGWIKMPLGTEVGLGRGDIVLDGDPGRSPIKRGHSTPKFLVHVYGGQTAEWIRMLLGMEVGLGPDHTVRWGPNFPQKGTQPPVFGPCLLWPNGWMDQDALWYADMPRPKQHFVRGGHSSTQKGSTAKGHSSPPPHFLTDVYCGQTAVCIRIPVGTDAGLGSGDIVLDGTQLTPMERDTTASTFRPMSIVAKRSPISATAELL